ncbi:hypothetical protein [Psychromonas sp. MB-3u-54]|uniref:hypothetical protein n=1 Tax=Psychromonas sp. MB-3u-54 TaxID=2058319 RepID=UPI0012FEECD9|nr:hypothetical protein [Psychromonas sp. MB-3u-54]
MEKLIKVAPDDFKPDHTVLFTGLRTGEIDALHWGKVDLENKLLYIDQSFVKGEKST